MFLYLKNTAYLASTSFLLSVSCILLRIFLSENMCVQTFHFINKTFAFWVINQCFLLSLILVLMLTATHWPSSPMRSHNEQPLHSLKNRWDTSDMQEAILFSREVFSTYECVSKCFRWKRKERQYSCFPWDEEPDPATTYTNLCDSQVRWLQWKCSQSVSVSGRPQKGSLSLLLSKSLNKKDYDIAATRNNLPWWHRIISDLPVFFFTQT